MRRYAFAMMLTALVALASCHRAGSELVGKWISTFRTKNGVTTVTEFRANGTFTSAYEIELDCSYKTDGGLLVISVSDPQTGQTSEGAMQVRLDGDTIYLKSPLQGTEESMQRVGAARPGVAPVVGKWASGLKGSRPALAEFTEDGRMTFKQTLKSSSGTYTVSGDSLILNFEGASPQTGKFRFDNGMLVLTPTSGTEQRLKRVNAE